MAAQLVCPQTLAAPCRDWLCPPLARHNCRPARCVWKDQGQRQHVRLQISAAAVAEGTGETTRSAQLFRWLEDHGVEPQAVTVADMVRNGQPLDVTVAARDLQPGDVALRIPEHMIITLDRVFEDSAMAELLTTNKLSELACLTLYLMYEKKNGRQSVWFEFIQELDRIQARGQSGAKSPLLWEEGQVETLLQGSPIVAEVAERLNGIEREYNELDTVWFMAGSLFKNYPYDVPTEAFSLNIFRQAFAAVQASVVHLQGVPLSKRFALVPLGPPLLSYSSTCKAMLKYDAKAREVQMVVDRAYAPGDPVYAWCGPQPNRRLLLNYSIVDDDNPYDKLSLTVTLPVADPLFTVKRILLQQYNLATQQAFQLPRDGALPEMLLPFLRLAHCPDAGALRRGDAFAADALDAPRDPAVEGAALGQLIAHLRSRLARYRTTEDEDDATLASVTAGPREKVAARLLRIEKRILNGALSHVLQLPGAEQAAASPPVSQVPGVRLS